MNQRITLAEVLVENARKRLMESYGFLYLKQWTLADNSRWHKIGITNDLRRRASEQNILPVPCLTLAWIKLDSMEEARAIEQAFHETLEIYRIKEANNRELFVLNDEQLAAVLIAIQQLAPESKMKTKLSNQHKSKEAVASNHC